MVSGITVSDHITNHDEDGETTDNECTDVQDCSRWRLKTEPVIVEFHSGSASTTRTESLDFPEASHSGSASTTRTESLDFPEASHSGSALTTRTKSLDSAETRCSISVKQDLSISRDYKLLRDSKETHQSGPRCESSCVKREPVSNVSVHTASVQQDTLVGCRDSRRLNPFDAGDIQNRKISDLGSRSRCSTESRSKFGEIMTKMAVESKRPVCRETEISSQFGEIKVEKPAAYVSNGTVRNKPKLPIAIVNSSEFGKLMRNKPAAYVSNGTVSKEPNLPLATVSSSGFGELMRNKASTSDSSLSAAGKYNHVPFVRNCESALRYSPTPSDSTSRSCSICGKVFYSERYIEEHMRTHTGEKPFECRVCGRGFSLSQNLAKHMRIHTGEKKYGCPHCGKMFRDSQSMKRHTRIHTGEMPYTCDVCSESFRYREIYIHHMKEHSSRVVPARRGRPRSTVSGDNISNTQLQAQPQQGRPCSTVSDDSISNMQLQAQPQPGHSCDTVSNDNISKIQLAAQPKQGRPCSTVSDDSISNTQLQAQPQQGRLCRTVSADINMQLDCKAQPQHGSAHDTMSNNSHVQLDSKAQPQHGSPHDTMSNDSHVQLDSKAQPQHGSPHDTMSNDSHVQLKGKAQSQEEHPCNTASNDSHVQLEGKTQSQEEHPCNTASNDRLLECKTQLEQDHPPSNNIEHLHSKLLFTNLRASNVTKVAAIDANSERNNRLNVSVPLQNTDRGQKEMGRYIDVTNSLAASRAGGRLGKSANKHGKRKRKPSCDNSKKMPNNRSNEYNYPMSYMNSVNYMHQMRFQLWAAWQQQALLGNQACSSPDVALDLSMSAGAASKCQTTASRCQTTVDGLNKTRDRKCVSSTSQHVNKTDGPTEAMSRKASSLVSSQSDAVRKRDVSIGLVPLNSASYTTQNVATCMSHKATSLVHSQRDAIREKDVPSFTTTSNHLGNTDSKSTVALNLTISSATHDESVNHSATLSASSLECSKAGKSKSTVALDLSVSSASDHGSELDSAVVSVSTLATYTSVGSKPIIAECSDFVESSSIIPDNQATDTDYEVRLYPSDGSCVPSLRDKDGHLPLNVASSEKVKSYNCSFELDLATSLVAIKRQTVSYSKDVAALDLAVSSPVFQVVDQIQLPDDISKRLACPKAKRGMLLGVGNVMLRLPAADCTKVSAVGTMDVAKLELVDKELVTLREKEELSYICPVTDLCNESNGKVCDSVLRENSCTTWSESIGSADVIENSRSSYNNCSNDTSMTVDGVITKQVVSKTEISKESATRNCGVDVKQNSSSSYNSCSDDTSMAIDGVTTTNKVISKAEISQNGHGSNVLSKAEISKEGHGPTVLSKAETSQNGHDSKVLSKAEISQNGHGSKVLSKAEISKEGHGPKVLSKAEISQNGHGSKVLSKSEISQNGRDSKVLSKAEISQNGRDSKSVLCTVCGKRVKCRSYLQIHMRTHTGERPHKCAVCGQGFAVSQNMYKHMRVHTGEKRYACDHCGRVFRDSQSRNRHVRLHTGEKPYGCDMCGEMFLYKVKLVSHKKNRCLNGGRREIVGRDETVGGGVCAEPLLYKEKLDSHKKNHCFNGGRQQPVGRGVCAEPFLYKEKLDSHKKNNFFNGGRQQPVSGVKSVGQGETVCRDVCGELFLYKQKLNSQKKNRCLNGGRQETVRRDVGNEFDEISKTAKKACSREVTNVFRSLQVPQEFTKRQVDENSKLQDVQKSTNLIGAKKSTTFGDPPKLNKSVRTTKSTKFLGVHKSINPGMLNESGSEEIRKTPCVELSTSLCECEICGSAFKQMEDLSAHIKNSHGKNKHCCEFCNVEFDLEEQLTKHIEVHTGGNLEADCHICRECGEVFDSKNELESHGLLHIEEGKLKCPVCRQLFVQGHHFTVHMKMHKHCERVRASSEDGDQAVQISSRSADFDRRSAGPAEFVQYREQTILRV